MLNQTPFTPIFNATFDLKTCVQCGAMAPKMKHCIGCKWARYCDRERQKANWRTHRTECCPDHALPTGIRTITYSHSLPCPNSTTIGGPAHRQLCNDSTIEGARVCLCAAADGFTWRTHTFSCLGLRLIPMTASKTKTKTISVFFFFIFGPHG